MATLELRTMTDCSYRLNIGGVLRCCISSLSQHMETCAGDHVEGDFVACLYCDSGVVLRDGVWRWPGLNDDRSAAPSAVSGAVEDQQ